MASSFAAAFLLALSTAVVLEEAESGEGVPPVVEEGVNRRLTVQEGAKSYRITCPVSGRPAPMILWKKDGEMIGAAWSRFRLHQNDRVLRIKFPQREDSGQYVCEAVNGFGRRVVEFSLEVYGREEEAPKALNGKTFSPDASVPPFFIRPADISALTAQPIQKNRGSSSLDLPCHASGQPNPDIQWLKNGVPIGFEDSRGPQLKPNRWTLHIASLREYHSGRYTCRVYNSLGSINATFNVLVSEAPMAAPKFRSEQSLNKTVVEGETANLRCTVFSPEPPHIKWVKRVEDLGSVQDNSSLFRVKDMNLAVLPYPAQLQLLPNETYVSTLSIPNVQRRHSGAYICVVNNPAGHLVYRFAYLEVGPSPSVRPVANGLPTHLMIGVAVAAVLLILLGYALVLLHRFHVSKGGAAPSSNGASSSLRPPPPSYPPPQLPSKEPNTPQRLLTPSSNGLYHNASAFSSQQRYVPSRSGHLRSAAVVTPTSRDYQLYDPAARVPLTQAQAQYPLGLGRWPMDEPTPQPYELDFEDSDGEHYPHQPMPLQPHPSLYSCR